LDSESNLTSESPLQDEKQWSKSISTEDGRQIDDSNEQHRNADGPIRDTFEGDAKVTSASVVQPEKHWSESISTKAGMRIDESDAQFSNADC
jgi:hypothetical protein